MRVAVAKSLSGIDSVELGEQPDPAPAVGQALIRIHGAGVGPWDVGFLSGGFPGVALPFVPGQEVAGVVEATGDGAGVQPGDRVYASLFPAGGGFAELALASADRLAPMPDQASFQEAAGLVIGAATAHDGLVDRGLLQAGETVLITAAAGGVGSAAVQIAAAMGARPVGVASPRNHEYLRGLGRLRSLRLSRRRLGRTGPGRSPRRGRRALRLRRWSDHGRGSGCRARWRPGDLGDPPIRSSPSRARHHGRIVRRPRGPAASRGTLAFGRLRAATPAGRSGAAVGPGSRGIGTGRGPTHTRKDRAPDRAVAARADGESCAVR